MTNKPKPQKLELTWIDKEVRPLLEPRILLEDAALSYHAKVKNGKKDQFENMLIFGNNLLALKSLEQKYTGKVKCVYINPPYNTGSASSTRRSKWWTLSFTPSIRCCKPNSAADSTIAGKQAGTCCYVQKAH